MVRTKEGGLVPGFVVTGLVLVALLLGGAFWLRQQAKQSEVVQPPVPEQPAGPPTEPIQPTAPERSQDTGSTDSRSTSVSQIPSTGVSLPQTGPSENVLLASVMVGVLAAVITSYLRSRRQTATF